MLGLYICLIFWLGINNTSIISEIDDKLLDYQLVTVDDYTLCGHIDKEFYDEVIKM